MWAALIAVVALVVLGFVVGGYIQGRWTWDGTGFEGASLWNWMQLLFVPVAVAIATFVLNQTAKRRDDKAQKAQKEREEALAHQRTQDVVLQSYINQMAELLIDKQLHDDPREHGDRRVTARAQTFLVLSQLDGDRKRFVLQFLREARLIMKDPEPLEGRTIQARVVGLTNVDLENADLSSIKLASTSLSRVNMKEANLSNSNLSDADLSCASLSGADLSRADLRDADLSDADLKNADLSYTDLRHAKITDEQLVTARSYKGAYCSLLESTTSEKSINGESTVSDG